MKEKKIFIVRHASPNDDGGLDKRGCEQSNELAKNILSHLLYGETQVCVSPLERARKTARIIAQKINGKSDIDIWEELYDLRERSNIHPKTLQGIVTRANEYDAANIVIVSHEGIVQGVPLMIGFPADNKSTEDMNNYMNQSKIRVNSDYAEGSIIYKNNIIQISHIG